MSQQTPNPGAHARRGPTFSLVTLEALDAWRAALRKRRQWRERLDAATTPGERRAAVEGLDRATVAAARAERDARDAMTSEAEP